MSKKLIVELSDDLDMRFRQTILRRYGFKQGNIKSATTEAIENWIKKGSHFTADGRIK